MVSVRFLSFFFFLLWCLRHAHRSHWWTDLGGGVVDMPPHLEGHIPAKKTIFGARIAVFKHNSQNIKTCTLSKLLYRFQPKTIKCPLWVGGWSKHAHHKSKMADGRHLEKIEKSPYLSNSLTNLSEIWQVTYFDPLAFF